MIKLQIYILIAAMLSCFSGRSASQTLMGSDAEIWNPYSGILYRLDPRPGSTDPLPPLTDVTDATGPIEFDLIAEPGSVWALSLLLPDSMTGLDGYPFYCTYDDSSGYHVQTNTFWNAGRSRTLAADSQGMVTIGIGMRFIAYHCPVGWNYQSTITCLATRLSDGLTLVATSHLRIPQSPTDQCGFGFPDIDVNISNLNAGYDYTFDGESGTIQPIITGTERGDSMKFTVAGDPGDKIGIGFVLPKYLQGEHGTIPVFFPSGSAREASGLQWDPASEHAMTADRSGAISFSLGFTVAIPDTTPPGEYVGQVITWFFYIGNLQKSRATSGHYEAPSEMEAIIVVKTLPSIPKILSLFPNFPNPFNSSTTIRYNVPRQAAVSIKVYSLLGQEIATLIDGEQSAGTHATRWDAGYAPSGVYICRLRAGTFTQTQKLILAR